MFVAFAEEQDLALCAEVEEKLRKPIALGNRIRVNGVQFYVLTFAHPDV